MRKKGKQLDLTIRKKKMSGPKKHRFVDKRKKTRKTIGSLYYSSDHEQKGDDHDSNNSSEGEGVYNIPVRRSILIRDIPKIGKLNVYGMEDVSKFFKEYESFCREKFREHTNFLVKEMGEYLEGTNYTAREPQYEVMKGKIIKQV